MNDLQIFEFEKTKIRTVLIDGEPWFVAKDVCDVLEIQNSRDAVSRLRDREKNTVVITDGTSGNPNQTVIRESAIYKLVFKSRLPNAERFADWITSEVLPSIRKTGMYAMESLTPRQWAEKMLEREIYIEEMESQMMIDAPKVKFHDDFQEARGNILMREAAKKIGWGEKKLFARLQQDDILISSSEPYQKYLDQGLFVMKTGLHIENGKPTQHATILVTPKGVQWLYRRYAEGIRERGKPYQLSAK